MYIKLLFCAHYDIPLIDLQGYRLNNNTLNFAVFAGYAFSQRHCNSSHFYAIPITHGKLNFMSSWLW